MKIVRIEFMNKKNIRYFDLLGYAFRSYWVWKQNKTKEMN